MSNTRTIDNSYVLITGGTGYIGSHVVVQTLEKNFKVIILDNLSNSKSDVLGKIKSLAGISADNEDNTARLVFVQGDIRDEELLNKLFSRYNIVSVMHFAALKSVAESQKYPDLYYDVNVMGTKNLLSVMKRYGCNNFIYSSSATVYGCELAPVTEDTPTGNLLLCNYARNKYDIEEYLKAEHDKGSLKEFSIVILRYFNPIGAHPSGLLGEDPNDIPNNIFPYLLRVARWSNDEHRSEDSPYKVLTVFGDNYDTPDGTCIRDYVHVQDLARAHIDVHDMILRSVGSGVHIYNVGTGKGTSVFELIETLNDVLRSKNKNTIAYRVGARRDGDIVISFAKVDKIYREVGFKTNCDVRQMCVDGLKFIGV